MQDIRLPQSRKEDFLYGGIIALLTDLVMLFLNIGTSFGNLYAGALLLIAEMLVPIWVITMLVEHLIAAPITKQIVKRFVKPGDSFGLVILLRITACVPVMSMCMTILGGMLGQLWIGNGWNLEPFETFLSHWPRNFCVAFWCEIIFAQPIARAVMKAIHRKKKAEVSTKR